MRAPSLLWHWQVGGPVCGQGDALEVSFLPLIPSSPSCGPSLLLYQKLLVSLVAMATGLQGPQEPAALPHCMGSFPPFKVKWESGEGEPPASDLEGDACPSSFVPDPQFGEEGPGGTQTVVKDGKGRGIYSLGYTAPPSPLKAQENSLSLASFPVCSFIFLHRKCGVMCRGSTAFGVRRKVEGLAALLCDLDSFLNLSGSSFTISRQ